jgi:hypothetical protein
MKIIGLIIVGVLLVVVGPFWMAILSSSHAIPTLTRITPGLIIVFLGVLFVLLLKGKKIKTGTNRLDG